MKIRMNNGKIVDVNRYEAHVLVDSHKGVIADLVPEVKKPVENKQVTETRPTTISYSTKDKKKK